MAKLITLAAFFAVLLVITGTTSALRTIVTTVEVDEPNQGARSQRKCREQIQKQDFSQCEQFLSQSIYLAFRKVEIEGRQQMKQECCKQLNQVDKQCQCDALEEVLREQQRQQCGEMESQEMMRRAREIQSYCRLPKQCDFEDILS